MQIENIENCDTNSFNSKIFLRAKYMGLYFKRDKLLNAEVLNSCLRELQINIFFNSEMKK